MKIQKLLFRGKKIADQEKLEFILMILFNLFNLVNFLIFIRVRGK
jgi:hypothetical protein